MQLQMNTNNGASPFMQVLRGYQHPYSPMAEVGHPFDQK